MYMYNVDIVDIVDIADLLMLTRILLTSAFQQKYYFWRKPLEVTSPTPFQQVDPCHLYPRWVKTFTMRFLTAWHDTGRAQMGTAIGPRFLAFHCGRAVCQAMTCWSTHQSDRILKAGAPCRLSLNKIWLPCHQKAPL